MVTPQNDLRQDILRNFCEIFRFLCDKPISLHVLNNNSCFDEFPWAVGQVCKRWREVFLSYPRLWTSLSLRYHPTDIVDVDRLHEMSRRTLLYLERSKHLPLTITVCTTCGETSTSIEDFPRTTWKLLLSCSERWERADLSLSHEPPLLDLLGCEMPIVKSLKFQVIRINDSHFPLCHPFTIAPRLVDLYILGWLRGWEFPWSQLTKVQIPMANRDIINNKTLETVLSQLKNVEELRTSSVYVWRTRDKPDRSSPPIRLPFLRLLSVSVYVHEMLTWLEAPLLEDLLVVGSEERYCSLTFTEELSSFIRRSSCHIRRLTLHNGERQLLPNVTKLLSSVEVLCIKMKIGGRGSFLAKHITQMNDGVYLPNLRELKVTCHQGRNAEKLMTAVSDLLETRNEESRLISVRREDRPKSRKARMFMSFK